MTLNGYGDEHGFNLVIKNTEDADATDVKAVLQPFRTPIAWEKTPQDSILSTGTTDGTTANKLVDSTADFVTDLITAGMIIENTTDNTFAIVDAVDDLNTLSLRADAQAGATSADMFISGEGYKVYLNFELSEAYYEYNGQTIANASSPWNGKTIPDLNGTTEANKRFLRGALTSGTTGGAATDTQTTTSVAGTNSTSSVGALSPRTPTHDHDVTVDIIPPYFEIVWIGRFL